MDTFKTVLVTNIPSHYRALLFNKIAEIYNEKFTVIYCSKSQYDRKWDIPELKHSHIFLSDKENWYGRYWKPEILLKLLKIKPDIIITSGFNPVMIFSFLYCLFKKIPHIVFTDSWSLTVDKLSFIHKFIRKIFFRFSNAFICIGNKGLEYLKENKIKSEKIFISPIFIDNNTFLSFKNLPKKYDILYSARFIEQKMPFFVIRILKELYIRKYCPTVLLMGNGPLKDEIINELKKSRINYFYPGFIQPSETAKYYSSAKILLFPTKADAWGIISNEACALGIPVITCANAGCADDLIITGKNGYVLPLDENIWVEKIIQLLTDNWLYEYYSQNSITSISDFSLEKSLNGFLNAIHFSLNK